MNSIADQTTLPGLPAPASADVRAGSPLCYHPTAQFNNVCLGDLPLPPWSCLDCPHFFPDELCMGGEF